MRGQAGGTRSGEFILQPIDSAHAVLAGSGQGPGRHLQSRLRRSERARLPLRPARHQGTSLAATEESPHEKPLPVPRRHARQPLLRRCRRRVA
ncbi:hypothetical protein ACPA9J_16045 [Pseudomonas aeruginosa]